MEIVIEEDSSPLLFLQLNFKFSLVDPAYFTFPSWTLTYSLLLLLLLKHFFELVLNVAHQQ